MGVGGLRANRPHTSFKMGWSNGVSPRGRWRVSIGAVIPPQSRKSGTEGRQDAIARLLGGLDRSSVGSLLSGSGLGLDLWCRTWTSFSFSPWPVLPVAWRNEETHAAVPRTLGSSRKVGLRAVASTVPILEVGGTISLLRPRFGSVVIRLAERAAGTSTSQPGINADGMEGMATGEAANVVIIFKRINADGTSITAGAVALRR